MLLQIFASKATKSYTRFSTNSRSVRISNATRNIFSRDRFNISQRHRKSLFHHSCKQFLIIRRVNNNYHLIINLSDVVLYSKSKASLIIWRKNNRHLPTVSQHQGFERANRLLQGRIKVLSRISEFPSQYHNHPTNSERHHTQLRIKLQPQTLEKHQAAVDLK